MKVKKPELPHVNVAILSSGSYRMPLKSDALFALKLDRRTKEGKLRFKAFEALLALDSAALSLGVGLFDLLPINPNRRDES